MKASLLEAWNTNLRVTEHLFDLLRDEDLKLRYAPRVRSIGLTVIHLHNVRRRWLGADGEMPASVSKIDRKASMTVPQLRTALQTSGRAVGKFLEQVAQTGAIPHYRGHPVTFLGYMLAHEAHHRGHILATLRVHGHPAPSESIYQLWEWDLE
ncbi:MAG: DinB family protein [Bacteroidota bacterium]